MIAQSQIVLRGNLLQTGELFISATDEAGRLIPPQRLKSQLFAWDSRSFYGTLIETAHQNNMPGLLLSPFSAVCFLVSPNPTDLASIHWSEELIQFQKVALLYSKVLAEGWFVPSFEAFQEGQIGWKLRCPAEEEEASLLSTFPEGPLQNIFDLDGWLNQVVLDLLRQEPQVAEAWDFLQAENPILQPLNGNDPVLPANKWLTEEQWLVLIGWQRDEVPFRMSIVLVPPEEEEEWSLRWLFQDLEQPGLLLETDLQGHPLAGEFPAHWLPHLEQRMAQEVDRLQQIVPWLQLQADAGQEQLLTELDDNQAWMFMDHDSLSLIQAGCSVLLPSWWEEMRSQKARLKARIKSSVGSSPRSLFGLDQLLQFDWRMVIGDVELTEEEFETILAEKKRLVSIRGRWIHFDPHTLSQMMQTMSRVRKNKGLSLREVLEMHWLGDGNKEHALENPLEHAADGADQLPDEQEHLQIEVELNSHLQKFVRQLQTVTSIPRITPPAELQATLRGYQIEGVSWLLFLRQYGLGGCLADDMGLGKTVQFIAYLLGSKQKEFTGPSLLICPTSVIGNWKKELERFAPSLQVYEHYGSQRTKGESFPEQVKAYDLVITSYTLAHLDQEELTSLQWDTICLDEAQTIKNTHTKQRKAIRQFESLHRIALTGTPIENRLTELWSIFDFLNPGYLGTLSSFTKTYVNKIEKQNDKQRIAQVQKLIRPFLLRRVKKDPAIQLDLPEKNEMKTFVSLTVEQGALYETVVQDLFEKLNTASGIEKKGLILGALTKLKQICDHPSLFLKEENASTSEERSNKLLRLLEVVEELRSAGDKCLIFTQYVEMGHLLQKVLERKLNESALFLHGGVPKAKRDQLVTRFQETATDGDQSGVFILSLKAGGTGLNLTAASHVIHYDRWWNPAVEDQATDRAFRIGQTRDVQVHKFVTLGTLEERIDEMIERKQTLSRQIVGSSENWITEMSTQELKELFDLRKEWIRK